MRFTVDGTIRLRTRLHSPQKYFLHLFILQTSNHKIIGVATYLARFSLYFEGSLYTHMSCVWLRTWDVSLQRWGWEECCLARGHGGRGEYWDQWKFPMEIYPLNTHTEKMILGPGFIPPTQLLFSIPFSFFLSIFISFLHALMVRLSLPFIFLSICTHTQQQQQKSSFYSLFLQGQNFQLTGGNLVL